MPGADVGGLLRSAVAALCLAAGVLHLSAAADHRGMAGHVAFFLLVAVVQSALAPAVLWAGRPGRWLALTAGANLAVVAVWVLSRTAGLPVDGSSAVEAIGFKDAITTLLELGAVAGVGFWWLLPEASRHVALESRRLATAMLGTGVWAFGAAGLFAGHTHSAGHTHEGGHAHAEATGGHGTHGHPLDAIVTAAPVTHEHGHDRDPVPVSHASGHDHAAADGRPPAHSHSPAHSPAHAHASAPAPAPAHDHDGAAPTSRQAAAHHHTEAGVEPEGTHHDGTHEHHNHNQEKEENRDDQERGSSLLDEVLKLIQPRSEVHQ